MKVLSVVGARPEFVQLSPIQWALRGAGDEHIVVHTGQHYEENMSAAFFSDLNLPDPDTNLGIGSGPPGAQTGSMMAAIEDILPEYDPDWVLVYGDTNSTIAATLAAVKSHYRVGHIEAGLRSFNRRMPEEHNRILTDHASDVLFAPTGRAVEQLRVEGLENRTVAVGDVMVDALLSIREDLEGVDVSFTNSLPDGSGYIVSTIHRAENTDDREHLDALLKAIGQLSVPVLLLVHPRLRQRAEEFGLVLDQGAIRAQPAVLYTDVIRLLVGSAGLITDSGGLQKQAYLLGVPCTTVRSETEWPETLEGQWNVLVDDPSRLENAVLRESPSPVTSAPFGDGDASNRIVDSLRQWEDDR